ncbi:fibronectin type III domain-containing protein [Croceivirga thetidis]|uniref:Metallophosphoesterase n=1 Tax=Croceivirga thetidis TaxID=2721623 RepID=A0ABX1GWD8_9FLAO|nr:fibronectin type III domain-containing protein [Croceivirga thetidis]NKI33280.1 metallophosphoesterase [Croceivirga thetidis]
MKASNQFLKCSVLLAILSFFNISAQEHGHGHEGLHHWEIPSKDPDRIILTFNGNPATKRAVTWRTNKQIEKAFAQIAKATLNSDFVDDAITIEAKTEAFNLGQYKGNAPLMVNYHSAVFEGLEPNTLYVYRVGDGTEYWSEWIQFRTAKTDYAPTQFVYFGDAQNEVLEHWSRVIRRAYQTAPNAAFVVHAGDLINNAHRDVEWAEWYKAGGFIHSQWTAIPVVGNHEFWHLTDEHEGRRLSIQWRPQFTLPVEKKLPTELHETVYTVDYQDVRIIVLNSNELLEEQTNYVEKQLKKSKAKWNILTCHHSVFSPAKGRDFQFARENWKPILDKYNVDLVLNGHDHTYARGHVPIRTADTANDTGLSTVYVTSVSGPKQYPLDRDQIKSYSVDGYVPDKAAEQTQFYQVITIEDDKLTYVAYTVLGEEYDRAVIRKDFKTGKKELLQSKE